MKSSAEEAQWRGDDYPEPHMAGARSESVGSEWERAETPPPPLLRWLGVAIALIVVSIVLAVVVPLLRSQS